MPDAFVGAVMSDLSGRRGRVLGTEPDPDGGERTLVRAEVPATELVRYAVELRVDDLRRGHVPRARSPATSRCPATSPTQVRKEHAAAGGH